MTGFPVLTLFLALRAKYTPYEDTVTNHICMNFFSSPSLPPSLPPSHQQTKLAWASMNSGDCFILDLGLTIYVWNGATAGLMEKRKSLDVARRIRDEERGGRAAMEVMGLWFEYEHFGYNALF